jgi:hypothetical protein
MNKLPLSEQGIKEKIEHVGSNIHTQPLDTCISNHSINLCCENKWP